MSTVGCFKCSEIQERGSCPTSGEDSAAWQNDPSKYGLAQTYESPAMCSVVIANSGKIYHQALVDQNTCNDPNYIARISFNVAKIFRDPGSKITCCSTDGCNWSQDSASNNLGLSQLNSSSSDSTVYYGYIGVAVAILIIILLCLLGCFLYYWRKNVEDEEYEEKENIRQLQDNFYGRNHELFNNYDNYERQRSISSYESSDRNTVASVGRGQPPVSKGSRRISVREATPPEAEAELYNYNYKDKWDRSLAQAGMSSSLEPPSEGNIKGKDRNTVRKAVSRNSYSSQDDSAWGSKYDRVDNDRRERDDTDDNKAWFVEF